MQLSIIIVNYNVQYFLEQCLCSVISAIKDIKAEIFVVDNNSSDDSITYLKSKFEQVIFIENKTNTGFSKANNQALHLAKGEHVLYLNPDTIIAEDTLMNCLNYLQSNSEAGAIGVKMVDGSGNFLPESKRSFPSPAASFYKLAGLSALFPKSELFNGYALGYLNENEIHEVDVLSGAYIMAKKTLLNYLKGFDEEFFMYGEDIDLSYRIIKAGFKNYYLGNNVIVHFKGESTKKSSLKYVHHFYNAMSIFVSKHYSNSQMKLTFLRAAIKTGSLLSSLNTQLRNSVNVFHTQSNNKLNIILLGDNSDTESAFKILANQKLPIKIKKIKNVEQLQNDNSGEVIFCTGILRYKKTIAYIQQLKNKFDFKWHGKGSNSIAGSNSKNEKGDIYA